MAKDNSGATGPSVVRNKVLHIVLPEAIYWNLQSCAIESRMSLKAFVIELGRAATPFGSETLALNLNRRDNDGTDTSISKAA